MTGDSNVGGNYEPPRIEERVEVDAPLVGVLSIEIRESAVFRPASGEE